MATLTASGSLGKDRAILCSAMYMGFINNNVNNQSDGETMPLTRRRLSPEESRYAALEAARAILIEAGPQAVTLKAVATRINRTHANLLHHFGSAAGLQKELAAYLAERVCETIADHMTVFSPETGNVRAVVDLTFDAFDTGGAAALASWMLITGNDDALDPIVSAILDLINQKAQVGLDEAVREGAQRVLREDTLALVLLALGDAQLGGQLSTAMELPRSAARDLATEFITTRVAAFWAAQGVTVA